MPFECVDSQAKTFLILYPRFENSTTHTAITSTKKKAKLLNLLCAYHQVRDNNCLICKFSNFLVSVVPITKDVVYNIINDTTATYFLQNFFAKNAHQSADQDFSFDSESSDDTLPDLENDFDDSTLEFKDSMLVSPFFYR